jgi:hypothetical protein
MHQGFILNKNEKEKYLVYRTIKLSSVFTLGKSNTQTQRFPKKFKKTQDRRFFESN